MEFGHLADIVEDAKRKRLDARRRRVFFRVTAKLAIKPESSQGGASLMARIQGPHAGKALTDRAELVLHRSISD
jgi:hypothetical protein